MKRDERKKLLEYLKNNKLHREMESLIIVIGCVIGMIICFILALIFE